MINNESFCCACWDYLRGLRPDAPNPVLYGLPAEIGEYLARQCHIEFEKQTLDKLKAAQANDQARTHNQTCC